MLVFLAVVLGIVALLAIPVGVTFRLERDGAVAGEIAIRWLFGLVRFRIPIPGARRRAAAPAAPAAARRRPRARARTGPAEVLALLRDSAFRERVLRLARDLFRAVHATGLFLHVRLGLGDPADTGRLWAVVGPLAALAQALPGADVRIEPAFLDPALEVHARGQLLLVPLHVAALAVAFALSPSSVRAFRTLRGAHA